MTWKERLKLARKQGHGEAALLAKLAGEEALTPAYIATRKKLLAKVGLDKEDMNSLIVHQAEMIMAKDRADLQERVHAYNKHIDDLYGVKEPEQFFDEEQQGKRPKVMGYPVTAVIRWMGKEGWEFEQAKRTFLAAGVSVADSTIKIQLAAATNGTRGEPAPLTLSQENELYDLSE